MNHKHSQTRFDGMPAVQKGERGVALMVAMFALLILTLIGLSILTRATTEVFINDNFKRAKNSALMAEAGTEEARFRLTPAAAGNRIDGTLTDAAASTAVVYIRANGAIAPTVQDASNRFRDTEWATIATRDASGTQTTVASTTTQATYFTSIMTGKVPYSWVKVTRKTETLAGQNVDGTGANQNVPVYYGPAWATGIISQYVHDAASQITHNWTRSNPVYLVTSLSVDETGAQRKIQTEVVFPPPIPTNAAIDSSEEVDLNGNLDVSGFDECQPGNPYAAVYGVSSAAAVSDPNPAQIIEGADAPSPAPPGSPSICDTCAFNWNIPNLINEYKQSTLFQPITTTGTNVNCSGGNCSGANANLGTPPNLPPPLTPTNSPVPKYYYAPGNLQLSSMNTIGYGVLIVEGDLTIQGGAYYEGIIIATGTVNFVGGGGTTINIRGAVISGNSINDTSSDFGGTVNVQYNSCSIANVFRQLPMVVLTFKDRALY
ncbi:MAG TPA: hypothetical protein VFS12_16330 [Terriglobia bacterium]|nr:hypothetical protein [Terriglobia bacterium]